MSKAELWDFWSNMGARWEQGTAMLVCIWKSWNLPGSWYGYASYLSIMSCPISIPQHARWRASFLPCTPASWPRQQASGIEAVERILMHACKHELYGTSYSNPIAVCSSCGILPHWILHSRNDMVHGFVMPYSFLWLYVVLWHVMRNRNIWYYEMDCSIDMLCHILTLCCIILHDNRLLKYETYTWVSCPIY